MSYKAEYQFWLEDAYFDVQTKEELKAILYAFFNFGIKMRLKIVFIKN